MKSIKIDVIGLTQPQYNNLVIFLERVSTTGKNEAVAYLELLNIIRTNAVAKEEDITG
jgi:hypothetical protein